MEYLVEKNNERIDTYLSKVLDVSRSKVSKMLDECISYIFDYLNTNVN